MPETSGARLVADKSPASHVRILLVDDRPTDLLEMEAALRDLGHHLVKAHNREEALRHLSAGEFALILIDLHPQKSSGIDTARQIRGLTGLRQPPIIFLMDSETSDLVLEQAGELGAVDFLVKPVKRVFLRAKVDRFVELFQTTERVRRREPGGPVPEVASALAASDARQSAILEAALDCVVTMDQNGCIVEFNSAAERTFGFNRAEVLGRRVADVLVPDALRQRHDRGMAQYLATGEGAIMGRRIEMPALRSDGTAFPVELAITRIDADGPPLFMAYLRDITDRHRAEARRSARLAVTQVLAAAQSVQDAAGRILESICQGLGWDLGAMWTLDRGAGVLRCQEVWRSPTIDAEEFEAISRASSFAPGVGLPGRVWTSGEPAWIPDVTKDQNFPRAPCAIQRGLHGAFACPILLGGDFLGVIEFFSRHIREPDADLLEMMATVSGQIGQFLDRKWAESFLRDSEQRFALFMQHLPGLAWIKDKQGRYVYANDAAERAFRRKRSDLYGKTDDEIFPPETAARFKENDCRAVANASGIQVVETLEDDRGVVRHSIVSKFPIMGPDGAASLVGGMAVDITDRLVAEESLREADRLKDEFLAMLAHELRNPLAPIRNALHIMGQAATDAAIVRQMSTVAERQTQHMARLLDDLLDVSRISRGRIELHKETVDLATVVNQAIESVRPLVDERKHELIVSILHQTLQVEGDRTRLEQVLVNLLNNACKYTRPGGQIELIAERQADEVVWRIRDTGVGIAPEVLPRVFDLFVQAERGLDRSQGGVGIGLTLVKKLVDLHGGMVTAHSDGLGKGSEFIVRLPLAPTLKDSAPRPIPDDGAPKALICRRVLIVDDNKDAATTLSMLLERAGQDVRTAFDGASALRVATEFRPEIVLLDIGMPGMDGFEVARRLRQRLETRRAVLVAVSGWGQDEDRKRSKQAGFDGHLVKPVELSLLRSLLADPQGALKESS